MYKKLKTAKWIGKKDKAYTVIKVSVLSAAF